MSSIDRMLRKARKIGYAIGTGWWKAYHKRKRVRAERRIGRFWKCL